MAIIQKGRELGIPPMYALSNIGIINGKPVVGAEVMLAMVYRDHGDQAIQVEETSADRCSVVYKRRNWGQARRFEWTSEDAQKAGLLGKGGPWSQYPAAMLRARCISAVARLAFPDSIGGMYTAEELGAEVTVTDDGEIEVVPPVVPIRAIKSNAADVVTTISPEPADDITRNKFEANWAKGTARAVAAGIAPGKKPGNEATMGDLNRAQRELMNEITARETLNAGLIEKIAQVKAIGGDVADVDPAQCTSVEIHEMLATLNEMLAAVPDDDSDGDAPF
jgi:hypothetical protein